MIRREELGDSIRHEFRRSIPSSQCMVCHSHPGTNMETTYFGYTWWDNEIDAEQMYPAKQRNPGPGDRQKVQLQNPEGSAPRGLWSDFGFLKKIDRPYFAKTLNHTQFPHFHSHASLF